MKPSEGQRKTFMNSKTPSKILISSKILENLTFLNVISSTMELQMIEDSPIARNDSSTS